MSIKSSVYIYLDDKNKTHKGNTFVSYFIFGMIVINIFALFLESYKSIYTENKSAFYYIELISIIIFSIEYLLRVWTAPLAHPKVSPTKARVKYISSFMGLVDLIAIVPFYLPFFFKIDLRIVRVLRLFRLLRILKLTRYHSSINLIKTVVSKTKSDILSTLFIVLILLILSSTLMYYIENEAQPEQFTNIGQSFWWAIATLTTVGMATYIQLLGLGKY